MNLEYSVVPERKEIAKKMMTRQDTGATWKVSYWPHVYQLYETTDGNIAFDTHGFHICIIGRERKAFKRMLIKVMLRLKNQLFLLKGTSARLEIKNIYIVQSTTCQVIIRITCQRSILKITWPGCSKGKVV